MIPVIPFPGVHTSLCDPPECGGTRDLLSTNVEYKSGRSNVVFCECRSQIVASVLQEDSSPAGFDEVSSHVGGGLNLRAATVQ